MRPVSQIATDFIAAHEALRLESYRDPAGVWTAGYGHTGPDVFAGLRIDAAQAGQWLARDLGIAASRLAAVVDRAVILDLTENQYAALLSFVFNLGANPKWTIWKRLNAKQYDQVPVEMTRFVYVGETKLQGLVNRRAAEVVLWSTNEPGSAPEAPPSAYTRVEPTPPASTNPAPLTRQPAFVAIAVTMALSAPDALQRFAAYLTPYADVPAVHRVLALVAAASPFAAAVAAAVLAYEHSRSTC